MSGAVEDIQSRGFIGVGAGHQQVFEHHGMHSILLNSTKIGTMDKLKKSTWGSAIVDLQNRSYFPETNAIKYRGLIEAGHENRTDERNKNV